MLFYVVNVVIKFVLLKNIDSIGIDNIVSIIL